MRFFFKRVLFSGLAIGLLLGIVFTIGSCKKADSFDTSPSAKLSFSGDSILFDTVFTTIGSTTRAFMVYNNSKLAVKISSIELLGGTGSNFKVNVDGIAGSFFSDVEIEGNDSLFLFVNVRVDPTNQNSPLVISDKIRFVTNGNTQEIELVAWGQDAHYIVANKWLNANLPYKIVAAEHQTVTWTADKPYLVYGYAVVDSTGSLYIEPGVNIHFHKNSGLWVYKGGSIHVNGSKDKPVYFKGDRLETEYSDIPGQWDRIWINEGAVDNVINYAIIENGFIGLQTETMDASMGNNLQLTNTIIRNMSGWGLFSRHYDIVASNNLIYNCGLDLMYLSIGGNYDFRHCTFANFWNGGVRQTPSLIVSNFYMDEPNQLMYVGDLDKAYFGNCIIYGNIEEELALAKSDDASKFNYKFENCLIRTKLNSDSLLSCIKNKDPLFEDFTLGKFNPLNTSPIINKGAAWVAQSVPYDLNGDPRTPMPDLGALQHKQ